MSGSLHPLYGALPWRSGGVHGAVYERNGAPVAFVAEGRGRTTDQAVAIARLLAAAPKLVEALDKLAVEAAGFLDYGGEYLIPIVGNTNIAVLRGRIEQARSALKAVGAE